MPSFNLYQREKGRKENKRDFLGEEREHEATKMGRRESARGGGGRTR
jgi:hypothetical protein